MERQAQENREFRYSAHPDTEVRMVSPDGRTIRGYGVVFNRESRTLYAGGMPFKEVILPESVSGVPLERVLCMHNHRSERLLGATHSKTMRVGVDDIGVWYETDLPEGPTGEDVRYSVMRGDTNGSSFTFTIDDGGDDWERRDGQIFRTIKRFSGIYEMGPVSEAAYLDTTVNLRSMPTFQDEEPAAKDETELFRARIQYIKALYNQ